MNRRKQPVLGPSSLRDLVGERFRSLDPRTRDIIGTAALLGYHPDVDTLIACFESDCDVIDALSHACDLGLVVAESGQPVAYRFRHALTQAAIRDALGADYERTLHARIASTLERLPDAITHIEQLAHHWLAAGDVVKARLYNDRVKAENRFL
jgi:predicted ATPase